MGLDINRPRTPDCLVLFCRRPALAVGKQRLAADVGPSAALRLAEGMLACALEDLRDWTGLRVIAPASPADCGWARGMLAEPALALAQPEGNLGTRLARVDEALRARGMQRILYIGSDAPVLAAADYAAGRAALDAHDVVLQPATDGGVTLMGARAPWPELSALPWSSGDLYTALAASCRAAALTVATLRSRYDIDDAQGLRALCRDLAGDPRAARQDLYRLLRSLGYCGPAATATERE